MIVPIESAIHVVSLTSVASSHEIVNGLIQLQIDSRAEYSALRDPEEDTLKDFTASPSNNNNDDTLQLKRGGEDEEDEQNSELSVKKWQISNRYYTALVYFTFPPQRIIGIPTVPESCPAVLVIVSKSDTSGLATALASLQSNSIEIAIVVLVFETEEADNDEFELEDLYAKDLSSISASLQSYMWPTIHLVQNAQSRQLKDNGIDDKEGNESFTKLEDFSNDLKNETKLGFDDDLSLFVQAAPSSSSFPNNFDSKQQQQQQQQQQESLASPPSPTDFDIEQTEALLFGDDATHFDLDQVFAKLQLLKVEADTMDPPQRRQFAERVALAVQRHID